MYRINAGIITATVGIIVQVHYFCDKMDNIHIK